MERINLIAQIKTYDLKLHSKPKDCKRKEIILLQMHLIDSTGSIALIASHDLNLLSLNTVFIFRKIRVTIIQNKLYLLYDNLSQLIKPTESMLVPMSDNLNQEDYSNIKLTQIAFDTIV